jgi:hypothetical protein
MRQSIILNLHKDILEYTGELFEKEFCRSAGIKTDDGEIEASSEQMDPNSPEYEEMMQRKALIQKKVEEQRRKLDIVKSQEKLVDVQHTSVTMPFNDITSRKPFSKKWTKN